MIVCACDELRSDPRRVRSQLFVHRRLFQAIKPQVDAVVEGLAVFVSDELRASLRECCTVGDIQLLISGVAEIDVDDWEASVRRRLHRGVAGGALVLAARAGDGRGAGAAWPCSGAHSPFFA